jgi:hypothetical protein
MKKRIALAALMAFAPTYAFPQSAVRQSGVVNPGDSPKWTQSGIMQSAGGLLGDQTGVGNNPFSVTDKNGLGQCFNTGPTGQPYHSLCLGHNGNNAVLTVDGVQSILPASAGAALPSSPLNAVKDFGADGGGVNDNSTVFTNIMAQSNSPVVYFPAGIYHIACGHNFVASSAVSFLGDGRGKTVFQLAPGCTPTTDYFSWTNFGGVSFRGITFDLNTPTLVSAQYGGLAFYVSGSNTLLGPTISDSEVINAGVSSGGTYNIRLNVLANTASFTVPIITRSRFTKSVADSASTFGEGIAFGGNGGFDSASLGNIHYAIVTENVVVNAGVQVDGDQGYWAGNDISGWGYGAGIFTTANQTPSIPTSQHDDIFIGNIIHDSPVGYDHDNTSLTCIENDGYRNIFVGNILHDCGGEGVRNYGSYTVFNGGAIFNNAKTTSIVGNYQRAGILVVASTGGGGLGEPYKSKNVSINNVAIYDTAGTQLYGYADAVDIDGPVSIIGSISGATAALNQLSPQGTIVGDPWQVLTLVQGAPAAGKISCATGATNPTAATGQMRYRQRPFYFDYVIDMTLTTNGACTGAVVVTMNIAADPGINSFDYPISGGINATTTVGLTGSVGHAAPANVVVRKASDGSYPAADGNVLEVIGHYPTAN